MDVIIYNQKVTISGMSNEASKWLKKKRAEEDLSFRELGKLVGLSHTVVANAEQSGDGSVDTWARLAEHYGESVLMVLYWAKKMKHPPTEDDVVLELQNRITVTMLELFPKSEWPGVLKRLALEVEDIHERRKRNNEAQAHSK